MVIFLLSENYCYQHEWHINITLPYDYQKSLMPPPTTDGKPLEVVLTLSIQQLQNVDEVRRVFDVDMYLILRWTESRLIIDPSNFSSALLSEDLTSRLWVPDLFVWGMKEMRIRRSFTDEVYISVDANKRITAYIGVTVTHQCAFDFQYYPMDKHICKLMFLIPRTSDKNLQLKWASVPIRTDSTEIPKYYHHFCYLPNSFTTWSVSGGSSAVNFYIIFHRHMLNHIIECYIPSSMFVVISWGSFLVSPEVVPGRTVLLVTNQLALITWFQSIRNSSPPSLLVKAIDIWLLSCITFVFVAMLEYATILLTLRNRDSVSQSRVENIRILNGHFTNQKKASKMKKTQWIKFDALRNMIKKEGWMIQDRISLIIFPICFLMYVIAYSLYFEFKSRPSTNDLTCA